MTFWCSPRPLVLASGSAARRALLEGAGVPIEVVPAGIDERRIEEEAALADPVEVAGLLARSKAGAVSVRLPGRLVLGADQTLAYGNRIFSKPASMAAARAQLQTLRGRTHQLHAAVTILDGGRTVLGHVATAHMTMRDLSDAFIDRYLAGAGASTLASVGGYQLEGLGVQLFSEIAGDYFTILGLPLLPVLAALRQHGALVA